MGPSRGIEIHGDPIVTRGVIYLNTFTDLYYVDPTRGALGYGVVVYGSGTWPPLRLGTAQTVFIEDNTFTRNRHAVASNNGSRYVFRFNTIIDNRENAAAIDAHGRGVWPRGSRQYEIYGNTVDNVVPRSAASVPIPYPIKSGIYTSGTTPSLTAPVRASFCNPDARVSFNSTVTTSRRIR